MLEAPDDFLKANFIPPAEQLPGMLPPKPFLITFWIEYATPPETPEH